MILTPYLQKRTLYPPLIQQKISSNLGLIVVIPAYKEPFLLLSLLSLHKCRLPNCDVEVIVVINDSAADTPETKKINQNTYEQALRWSAKNSTLRRKYFILYQSDLAPKFAGVGLARKIGMDEACYRLEKIRKKKGIIACFDADSRCEESYFMAIENHFERHKSIAACNIYFEHPLTGVEQEEAVYTAIISYELHLRYFINAQRWAGCPFAFHTIGSSMAVRADFYQKQGGMNRRKAGEDFYFLHKFIGLGNFKPLTATTIIPSARVSDRVPFGTGKAIGDILRKKSTYLTYNFQTFIDLHFFLRRLKKIYNQPDDWTSATLPNSIRKFLIHQQFDEKLQEIHQNTRTFPSFKKRFFHWFNAFMVIKFAHFARDTYYGNMPVNEGAQLLLNQLDIKTPSLSNIDLLKQLRKLDREGKF